MKSIQILLISINLLFFSNMAFCQTAYIDTTFAQVPLTFTINQGQFLPNIKFIAEGNNENLTMDDAPDSTYTFREAGTLMKPSMDNTSIIAATSDSIFIKLYSFMEFYNINQNPEFISEEPSSWNSNYFIGNNRDDWVMDVPNYAKITHVNLYDGIDLQYTSEKRRIKYDLIVRKGADPSIIQFKLPGTTWENNGIVSYDRTQIFYTIKSLYNPPECYQYIDGKEIKVDLKYREITRIPGTGINVYVIVGYAIGEYNPDYELHIKPKYIDGISYMGKRIIGSIIGMDVDDSGNVYTAGEAGFPVIVNVNSTKIYILKLDAENGMPVFVSYIIANNYIIVKDIEVDNTGIYIAGILSINSTNYPITENAYDKTMKSSESFISKITPEGNEFIYSTFLGGNYTDEINYLSIDKESNVIVTGTTHSLDFPITPDSYDPFSENRTSNRFISKINSNGSGLIFSTYFKYGNISDIYIDDFNYIYLTGSTGSYKFPITEGSYNYYYNKSLNEDYQNDLFVTKFDRDGKNLIFSTHFGGQGSDNGQTIKVNNSGEIYIIGNTASSNFPVTQDANDTSFNGGEYDVFLTKMNSVGSNIIYSTFIGGSEIEYSNGLIIDDFGNLLISGHTRSSNFPVTSDAFNKIYHGDWDLVLLKFDKHENKLIYSTFIGGNRSGRIQP